MAVVRVRCGRFRKLVGGGDQYLAGASLTQDRQNGVAVAPALQVQVRMNQMNQTVLGLTLERGTLEVKEGRHPAFDPPLPVPRTAAVLRINQLTEHIT